MHFRKRSFTVFGANVGSVKVIYAHLDLESECKAGKMPTLNRDASIAFTQTLVETQAKEKKFHNSGPENRFESYMVR